MAVGATSTPRQVLAQALVRSHWAMAYSTSERIATATNQPMASQAGITGRAANSVPKAMTMRAGRFLADATNRAMAASTSEAAFAARFPAGFVVCPACGCTTTDTPPVSHPVVEITPRHDHLVSA